MGPKVSPICLPGTSSEYDPGNVLGLISGWGSTNARSHVIKLRGAKLPSLLPYQCQKVKGVNPEIDISSFVFTENMICAGNDKGVDSCEGDSGGAFAVQDPKETAPNSMLLVCPGAPSVGPTGCTQRVRTTLTG